MNVYALNCAVCGKPLGTTFYAAAAALPQYCHEHDDPSVKAVKPAENKMQKPASNKDSRPEATDAALVLAVKHGLKISDIVGTGAGGRVTKADVEAAIKPMDESGIPF